jgi:hypothetical protein
VVAVITRTNPQTAAEPDDTILGRLLGSTIDDLPPAVRRFHASTEDVVGHGTFSVEQARSRAGRLVSRAMHMPRAEGETPVALSITRRVQATDRPGVEHWRRTFNDEVTASNQTIDGRHLLERIGRLEVRFAVDVECRRLRFRQVGTLLRIGPVRLRVPRSMSPVIAASVGAVGEHLDVSVRISVPLLGPIFNYAGQFSPTSRT